MNYARIEARYFHIDLMDCSLRKVLNLTFDWLVEAYSYDSEGWEKNYARTFDRSLSKEEFEQGYDLVDIDVLGVDPGTVNFG